MVLIDKVGERYLTNTGHEMEILEYNSHKNCTVRFNDGVILKNKEYRKIKKGEIRYPLHQSIYGIGYLGIGNYKPRIKGKITIAYQTWADIFKRCYNTNTQEKNPTYKECTVDEHWHNFQNFAKWFENNHKEGFQLDKDILVKGNKIYSPKTCCFVPREVNSLFKKCKKASNLPAGVSKMGNKYQSRMHKNNKTFYLGTYSTIEEAFQAYKIAKEYYIREVADRHRGKIEEKVYTAMINYKVEITD